MFAVTIENIWLDPWLKSLFPDFPSLAPQPPSALWILTFGAIGIVCVVLMVGQVLLMRPRRRDAQVENRRGNFGTSRVAALCNVVSRHQRHHSGAPLIDVPPGARGENSHGSPAPRLASPTMFIA